MSKRTIGILFILTVIMAIVGVGLIVAGVVGSTFTPTGNGYSTTGHFGNLTLFIIGVILASLAGIPYLIAWIGALATMGLVCAGVHLSWDCFAYLPDRRSHHACWCSAIFTISAALRSASS